MRFRPVPALIGFWSALSAVFGDAGEFGAEPIVLVGAGYVSISPAQIDFAVFPSGAVLRSNGERIEIIKPGEVTAVHPSVRRLSVGKIHLLPESEKSDLARHLERFFDQVETSHENRRVSRKSVRVVADWILSLELPYGEAFETKLQEEWGVRPD